MNSNRLRRFSMFDSFDDDFCLDFINYITEKERKNPRYQHKPPSKEYLEALRIENRVWMKQHVEDRNDRIHR